MRRCILALVALSATLALTACSSGQTNRAASTTSQTFPDFHATADPTTSTSATSAPTTSVVPPVVTTASTEAAPTSAAAPVEVTCADVNGVFVAHGTDGRGDCEPADPRPSCHVPPSQQDGNYLASLTMTPPFSQGTIDYPFMIGSASNADYWKAAGSWQMAPQPTG